MNSWLRSGALWTLNRGNAPRAELQLACHCSVCPGASPLGFQRAFDARLHIGSLLI